MTADIIVPIDGSAASWRGFEVAIALAQRFDADVEVVQVESDPVDADLAREQLAIDIDRRAPIEVPVTTNVQLERAVRRRDDQLADRDGPRCSRGHGVTRKGAVRRSVGERRRSDPPAHVRPDRARGPSGRTHDFGGPLVITVDGSEESEAALPLGVAWAVELGTTPWIVHATKSSPPGGDGDVTDAVYLARLASELREAAHHAVEFDELHDEHPVAAVCAYAQRHEVSLIVASSHGRSGLSRLTMGSVTSGFVRHAPCPVLVFRLPHPPRVSPA